MPKNQKLSATDEAILRMEPTAKEMKKRQLARQEATNKRLRQEMEDIRSGRARNPMTEAFLAFIGKEDGGEIKKPGIGFKAGGAVCRGMGAAMRGGKFSGVK